MEIVFLERDSVGQDVDVSGFSELGHVTFYAMTRGEEEVRQRVRDAEVIIVNKAPMNERTLADAHALRMIAVLATGYNNCNVAYCKSRGIRVCNAVNYATAIVAQHTMTMALCLSQHILTYNAYVHSGAYARSGQFTCFTPVFSELEGKTWGIVGMGHIGSRVAQLASAFGCRVIWHSLTGRSTTGNFAPVSKAQLLEESDILSLHCPLSELSFHFLDAEAFSQMKKNALVINVSRGPVVDRDALVQALSEHRIAGAALDVYDTEPMEEDDPLLCLQEKERLLLTPHVAWASVEARQRCVQEAYENIHAFMQGTVRNAVNP